MDERALNDAIELVLLRRCETQSIEVKAARGGTPRLYDTLSSFSNQADGGIVIFGIDEDAGYEVCGVFDPQRLQKDVVEQCKEMQPELHPSFATTVWKGAILVGAFLEGLPAGMRPAYRRTAGITKGSYVRVGDQDLHMTQAELYSIETFKDGVRSDVSVSPHATHEMMDEERVDAFVRDAKEGRPRLSHRDASEVLSLTGAERGGVPTLAGLMCLGDYPQQVYPNLCMTAVAVAGTEITQAEDGTRFLDSKRLEGTVDQIIEDAMAFVRRNTRTKVVVEEGRRRDIPEYPENAVREVVTNSLMHRDYGPYSDGTPCRLAIYSDRLECWNPGGIYGGQSVDDLGHENMPTRNPTLVSLLEIMRVAENRHSGIPVIRDEMRRAGLRQPVFVDSRDTFTVRLYSLPEGRHESIGGMEELSREALIAFCDVPRSRQEVADHFGVNVSYVAHAYLNPLADAGELVRTLPDRPRSKNQRFVARRRQQ